MVFSNFFNFFGIFVECSITGREETQRNDLLPFLSFVAFPNLFWLETNLWWYFLNFCIFLLFFLEFSIMGRVWPHRNDFFYCLSFAGFPNLFWLVKKLLWCFLIFLIFCYFCRIFNYGSGRNTTERFFAFSLFRSLSQPILARNEVMMVFSKFFNFLLFFWNLLLRVG